MIKELELLREEIKNESLKAKEEMMSIEDEKKRYTFYSINMTLIKLTIILDRVIEQLKSNKEK